MKYVGMIKSVVEIESQQKGTPGLEFTVEINYKRSGEDWIPVDSYSRRIWLYLPDDSTAREITMKKLATLGWTGGPIENAGLAGKEVEIVSKMEVYKGEEKERFDFPLPDRESSNRSDSAKLKIDQILSAAAAPEMSLNKPAVKAGGQAAAKAEEAPFENSSPQEAQQATTGQDLQDEGDDLF